MNNNPTYSFIQENNICSDKCWRVAKDMWNKQITDYNLYPNQDNFTKCVSPNVRIPEFHYDHINLRGRPGYGLSDECLIDKYSSLRNDPNILTQDRCPNQLHGRVFQGGPKLKAIDRDIDKELDVLSGSDTNPFKCKKTLMELQTYKFIPLLDCVKDVQEEQNIVPKWVWGGEDTRSYVNRVEFNKSCTWRGRTNNTSI
jgi:hypothetical protein